LAASGPNVVLTYVGLEKRGDIAVQHLQSYVYTSGPDSKEVAFTGQLSGMDFYLDAATLLPLTLTFNVHPDDDASTNIPVEIDFSKYQSVDGVQVAYHVQKFFRGGLMIDFNATSVAVNSGLPDSLFAVQ
jgi:hypothetical protein